MHCFRLDMNDKMIKIAADQAVAMKEKNIIAPYHFIRVRRSKLVI